MSMCVGSCKCADCKASLNFDALRPLSNPFLVQNKILEALEFYANQLLDYNEVVSQELLDDKGQKARDVLELLKTKQ